MKPRAEFDLLQTEIADGSMLIEASAGTGKTFTIAGLVLRLLLEKPDLSIDQILVTTFTELATAELRDRIRRLLRRAFDAFQAGQSEEKFLAHLLVRHADHRAVAQLLEAALQEFDQAPIYTIHGFCHRVLSDRAFESRTLFDAELVTDQTTLLREIAEDFWRKHFYEGDPLVTLLALKNGFSIAKLLESLDELVRNPTLTILPADLASCDEAKARLSEIAVELRGCWGRESDALRQLFADGSWAMHSHGKPEKMLPLLDDLEQCLSAHGASVTRLASIESFAASMIKERVRKGQPTPKHRVFDCCEKLLKAEPEFIAALWAEFYCWAEAELRARKTSRNVVSFDDLLTRVNDALASPSGPSLATALRKKYRAALVDEFQDTDPVQYSIFSRIYRGSNAPVAFIGDPKQAIYAFRGADVFTYLDAARESARQFTLTTNWRSETGLIEAVNTVFDRPRPFVLNEIGFSPGSGSPEADKRVLTIAGQRKPPFQVWLAPGDEMKANQEQLPDAVASEIVRLLTSETVIDGDKVKPRHIAILISFNRHAKPLQDALRKRGVSSVVYSDASVFQSAEARELRQVLGAIAQPGREKLVRAALATEALGFSGDQLDRLTREEAAWESHLLRFQKYHEIWRERGFIQMIRRLSVDEGIRPRLLRYQDGERRLTNFLHLTELAHSACVEHRLGMAGVPKWLSEQIQNSRFATREEYELRLESDERAVRILTVHKSKGLEFEIVFAPYSWVEAKARKTFHDSAHGDRLTLDLAAPEAHKLERESEALAESSRSLYVALTRAKHRSYMVWGKFSKEQKSAPACLLDAPLSEGDLFEQLKARSAASNAQQLRAATERALGASKNIAITDIPAPNEQCYDATGGAEVELRARHFTGTIDRTWGVASFTRLATGREPDQSDEGAAESAEAIADQTPEAAQGIFAFPKGARAGTCLHEILEETDFTDLSTAPAIVSRWLRAYNIDGFDEVVLQNVRDLATLALASDGVTLARSAKTARIPELEFSFPVDALTPARLARVFAQRHRASPETPPLKIERLQFQTVSGFLRGFVDLIFEQEGKFYIVDWKSNWLGNGAPDYNRVALQTEMHRNFYSLQLAIYSVALHRYLRTRLRGYDYDRHFGGAFYVFLRGIEPANPELGIHHERPSHEFIEELSALFAHGN